jgi:hypothetical protein
MLDMSCNEEEGGAYVLPPATSLLDVEDCWVCAISKARLCRGIVVSLF